MNGCEIGIEDGEDYVLEKERLLASVGDKCGKTCDVRERETESEQRREGFLFFCLSDSES